MARPPILPHLAAEAPLASVQIRQTLAFGLVPLGLALLLMAAGAPDRPSAGLWGGALGALGGMAFLWTLWRRSAGRPLRGFSVVHYFVRYFFVVLCPLLLWSVFGDMILDLAGAMPPILWGLLLLVYPASRMLHEIVGPDPMVAPRVEMAYIVCRQIEMVLIVFSIAGILSGAIVDANRNYPTDPAPLLIVIWLLALLALLAGAILGVSHAVRLFTRASPPQPLDDAPPPAAPSRGEGPRFGSDRF